MQEVRVEFQSQMTVQQCVQTFSTAVKSSYGGARRLLRGVAALRGEGSGGLEFFVPPATGGATQPTWQSGAWVPGYSKMHGASRMAVHIYVVDHGAQREIQLVGPYGVGEKGSTERLLNKIAEDFR
jgi:hypothetical protein